MQINRLFQIVYILLNKKSVTANELAEKFEVSARTIYRDIETLCSAGIPVYMAKGKGGGIRLLDNFVLNKSLLSEEEQNEILTALQGLNATKYPDVDNVISKLGLLFNKCDYNWIDVDFTNWGSNERKKFDLLKNSIISKRIIEFDYYGSSGEKTSRSVEPIQLWFKDKSWYLRGFCLSKDSIRIFKFSRIRDLKVTEKTFERVFPLEAFSEPVRGDNYRSVNLKLKIQSFSAYRVYDEFDEENITHNDDGSFTVNISFPEDEWVYGYILSFGSNAEVIEPEYMRDIIRERLKEALKKYI